jgi:hypothetical protein
MAASKVVAMVVYLAERSADEWVYYLEPVPALRLVEHLGDHSAVRSERQKAARWAENWAASSAVAMAVEWADWSAAAMASQSAAPRAEKSVDHSADG